MKLREDHQQCVQQDYWEPISAPANLGRRTQHGDQLVDDRLSPKDPFLGGKGECSDKSRLARGHRLRCASRPRESSDLCGRVPGRERCRQKSRRRHPSASLMKSEKAWHAGHVAARKAMGPFLIAAVGTAALSIALQPAPVVYVVALGVSLLSTVLALGIGAASASHAAREIIR